MKKFFNRLFKLWDMPWVKVVVYSVLLLSIFIASLLYIEKEFSEFFDYMWTILLGNETLSVIAVAIITVVVTIIVRIIEKHYEEDHKTESDHHKIIAKYSKHKMVKIEQNGTFYNKDGVYMELHHVYRKRKAKYDVKDPLESTSAKILDEVSKFNNEGRLILPSVNVFTNNVSCGNTNPTDEGPLVVQIFDNPEITQLPDFVISNSVDFFKAHNYSKVDNNLTIRLDDFTYDSKTRNLELYTSRSYYYHMLLTNRCMDYMISNGMSIRKVYEYGDKITSLKNSKLSNQIGINGMIITKDGYLLVEKRGSTKTTWKNKFAQPISLALKASDLGLEEYDGIGSDAIYCENKLVGVIKKTIAKNFGFMDKEAKEKLKNEFVEKGKTPPDLDYEKDDFVKITMTENLLGIARDLLEGGKPNFYFYVQLCDTKDVVLEKIQKHAKNVDYNILSKDKLDSDYYFIKYEDILIDFEYFLKVKTSEVCRIKRVDEPRCSRKEAKADDKRAKRLMRKKHLYYGCGEALLVTLSYLELCHKRIESIKRQEAEMPIKEE